MRLCFYTISVSPHQLPLARELVKRLGVDRYRYVYIRGINDERAKLGWNETMGEWGVSASEADQLLQECDVLITDRRDWELIWNRHSEKRCTIYASERWFKPPIGILRLVSPSYLRMARLFVRLLEKDAIICMPIGIHAARDMARLCGLMHGDLRCLFRAPKLEFERAPGGRIWASGGVDECGSGGVRCCLDKMRMWGYFVEECKIENVKCKIANLKVLWVGRLLGWKRVDTIIRAVGELAVGFSGSGNGEGLAVGFSGSGNGEGLAVGFSGSGASTGSTHSTRLNISLDIYGIGPEEARLKRLAAKYGDVIKFHPPVPIEQVRQLMREHDVYVLASNAYEGWGAVVSEALEEGMKVIGTYEAGSSATILPESCLFHAGDWRRLAELLQSDLPNVGIGDWTAKKAAEKLLKVCGL